MAAALPVFDFATNSIVERIAGADPAVGFPRFAEYPPSKGKLGFPRCLFEKPFPPNEKFWLKDVDFSCVSPWNDTYGRFRAGTAITKRHILFAKHFPMQKGTRILFVDNDGEVCPVYIEATQPVVKADLVVGLLNAELTPNIHPAKILPPDYEKYIGDGDGLPVVAFNQWEEAFLAELKGIVTNGTSHYIGSREPTTECWRRFLKRMKGGDSGDPVFILIGNEPILLNTITGGGPTGGPGIHNRRRDIEAAMDELCPGYKLEEFDFSKVRCGDGK